MRRRKCFRSPLSPSLTLVGIEQRALFLSLSLSPSTTYFSSFLPFCISVCFTCDQHHDRVFTRVPIITFSAVLCATRRRAVATRLKKKPFFSLCCRWREKESSLFSNCCCTRFYVRERERKEKKKKWIAARCAARGKLCYRPIRKCDDDQSDDECVKKVKQWTEPAIGTDASFHSIGRVKVSRRRRRRLKVKMRITM